ncbi:MAG: nitroreductase [Bacteroidales bacterium]|nr:nitroreductase [Bacteroidales bacterium]
MNNGSDIIINWIKDRKSTFLNGLKKGGKIQDEIIEQLLDTAIWAPSHGLVQPWFYKVFTGRGLEEFYLEQQRIYKEITPEDKFVLAKYDKYTDKKNYVSHVIVVIMKRDPKRRFPVQEDLVSVACTIQNMYLCMKSFGIAGYLSTGNICYTSQMRTYLGLEEEDTCLGFFTLGLPDENAKERPRKRIPAADKTEWVRGDG